MGMFEDTHKHMCSLKHVNTLIQLSAPLEYLVQLLQPRHLHHSAVPATMCGGLEQRAEGCKGQRGVGMMNDITYVLLLHM